MTAYERKDCCPVDIWTEHLEKRHLPYLEPWTKRISGKMTATDFPAHAAELPLWYENSLKELGRWDCLVSVYETPVGIGGFRGIEVAPDAGRLYLMLGESGYNLIRTATYATLRILDRAFQTFSQVEAAVYANHAEYLDALGRMGFTQSEPMGDTVLVRVEKGVYLGRKYMF